GRNPLHAGDFFERLPPQRARPIIRRRVHADEPLFGGAKNHWIVATPAMRIAMFVRVVTEQSAALTQQLHDDWIRSEDVFAFVFGQSCQIPAAIIERRVSLELVALAGIEVIHAVSWRRVHDAAALI